MGKTCHTPYYMEKTKIHALIETAFDYLTAEDKKAIDKSLDCDQALFIFGFDNNAKTLNVIAVVVLYVMSNKGTYINWLVVSSKTFDQKIYGKWATNQPFCAMGLGSFLLHMIQLQAASNDSELDLYLQVNTNSAAF